MNAPIPSKPSLLLVLLGLGLCTSACNSESFIYNNDEPRDRADAGDMPQPDGGMADQSTNNRTNNTTAAWCEDPQDSKRFAIWSHGATADVSHDGIGAKGGPTLSSGVGVFDLDGDGDNDLVVTSQGSELTYLQNDGAGNFTDATEAAGLAGLTATTSVSGADFDGDSDIDLLIGRTTGSYLLVNDGGRFTDQARELGVFDPIDMVSGASFSDFDGDGDLDVYITSYHRPITGEDFFPKLRNRLLRNDGGSFTPLATSPGGVDSAGMTLGSTWWDFDRDGRPDLYVVNDFGMIHGPNQLWRNVGPDPTDPDNWLFEDIAASAGLDIKVFSMGVAMADVDNDGDRDAYVSNMANNVLHIRDGESTRDEATERGVASGVVTDKDAQEMGPASYSMGVIPDMDTFFRDYADEASQLHTLTSWGAVFFDADHDGWQDLFVANGQVGTDATPEARLQSNDLYLSRGGGELSKSACWVLSENRGATRGAAVGDLDGDGDLDLVWTNNGDVGFGGLVVRRNDIADGNWLIVELKGRAPNTDAIGARLTLSIGDMVQTRWIDGGQGYMSVSERVAHFGLGEASVVDELVVIWPDGTRTDVPVAAVNRRVTVEEP